MIRLQTSYSIFSSGAENQPPCPYGTLCLLVVILCDISIFVILWWFGKLCFFLLHKYSFEGTKLATSYQKFMIYSYTQYLSFHFLHWQYLFRFLFTSHQLFLFVVLISFLTRFFNNIRDNQWEQIQIRDSWWEQMQLQKHAHFFSKYLTHFLVVF